MNTLSKKLHFLIQKKYKNLSMNQCFIEDSKRFKKFSFKHKDILIDFSKNRINDEIFNSLIELARESNILEMREKMFSGSKINYSENRAVLHTFLRNFSEEKIIIDNKNIKNHITEERFKINKLISKIHSGYWRGFSGKKITDAVNIGIGGSDLGPKMVINALMPYHIGKTRIHFISNIDGNSVSEILKKINPERTIFIVSSKSFSTQETLQNAMTIRKWLINFYHNKEECIKNHFIAISSEKEKVKNFGIDSENCFSMWNWVGGRYSLWSSIGITIALAIGLENFQELLEGAYIMDNHFRNTPLEKNMPVILAMISILYSNFYNSQSHAVLPYDDRLNYLVHYLQQADMESNGKSCDINGNLVNYQTGTILWGGVGTNGQHAFHQLLHQGNILIPVDFIIVKHTHHQFKTHHNMLVANCLAQSQALMQGKDIPKQNNNIKTQNHILQQQIIRGNKPSNTIILDKLTPSSLGQLIALYEHKIFVQGIVWKINSFDQWGVELGKVLTQSILDIINKKNMDKNIEEYDNSTYGLLKELII